ncbi:MAG: glycoside hydrolase family 3 N-terminal domain-containing protein [Melioribacteraceae bacterium]
MKSYLNNLLYFVLIILPIDEAISQSKYPYQDANLPVEKRITDLLQRMTVDEKIQQLDMYWGKEVANMDGSSVVSFSQQKVEEVFGTTGIGSIHDFYPISAKITNEIQKYAIEKTRLGIPIMVIEEGLHGYAGKGSTVFPIPLQMSSMWDTSLVHKIGKVIATEARAHGIHMILGPVLDMARDPRWGRVEETYGEDPYLDALCGVAMVKGLQGKSLASSDAVIAEPKHFGVHSIPEAGCNISPVSIGEREARSSFLYVFEKAIRDGGAMGIMAAYHELDGIPCVTNKWLLTDVLRNEWGFKGFVLSDLGAIRMSLESHKVAVDTSDALTQTLKAGLNMQFYDFDHKGFSKGIKNAVEKKMLSQKELDNSISDILRVKFLLGLFDKPYSDTTLIAKVLHTEENQKLALKAAQEGIVLLKNEKNTLPINKDVKSIAVVGPLAVSEYMGGYTNADAKGISILEGLKQRTGNTIQVNYEAGYTRDSSKSSEEYRNKAEELVKKSDMTIVVLGEEPNVIGEGKDRESLDLDKEQDELIQSLHKTGKPIVVILFNGRPLSICWIADNIPAIVEGWFAGEKGGLAIADILLGKINPSGKLPITFPRSAGQIPFYYNRKPTAKHKYVDNPIINKPLFCFGHGLSYTNFEYSDMQISPLKIPINGKADISITIKNTGKVKGTEVVQLYVRDMIGSVATPVLSLKGFNRITLDPGEIGTVNYQVGAEELSLWNRLMKRVVEPGEFSIMIGSSSEDIRQKSSLWVVDK